MRVAPLDVVEVVDVVADRSLRLGDNHVRPRVECDFQKRSSGRLHLPIARPGLVKSAGDTQYTQDPFGNVQTRSGPHVPGGMQEYAYTTFNLPSHVTLQSGATQGVDFAYDADGTRVVKQTDTEITYYAGDLYQLTTSVSSTSQRFMIYAGGRARGRGGDSSIQFRALGRELLARRRTRFDREHHRRRRFSDRWTSLRCVRRRARPHRRCHATTVRIHGPRAGSRARTREHARSDVRSPPRAVHVARSGNSIALWARVESVCVQSRQQAVAQISQSSTARPGTRRNSLVL